jgi:hypothetical protein
MVKTYTPPDSSLVLPELRAPWNWSIERKHAHALALAEKLIDTKPQLAEIWLKEVDRLDKLRVKPD